ncbi:SDR family oxidoreductase [Bradyrhizobium liaoningense]
MSYLAPNLLDGRVVLITGGGTGLGLAMGRKFLELGAEIVICGRRGSVLSDAKTSLEADFPGRVRVKVCDVRSSDAVEEMMEDIFAAQPIDTLVNNAAANFIAQSHELSPRAADAILSVTLHGALYCTLTAARNWIKARKAGAILSILSTSTIAGRAFTTPSSMAKSGLLAMTRSLAVEWGPRNIRVNAIAPGAFPTPGASARLYPASRQGQHPRTYARVPLQRQGDHNELATLAAFIISDAAAYMTGEMVVLDGGAHLQSSGVDDLLAWSDEQWSAHRRSIVKPA